MGQQRDSLDTFTFQRLQYFVHRFPNYLLLLTLCISFQLYSQNPDINLLRDINVHRNTNLDPAFRLLSNTTTPISIVAPLALFGMSYITKDTSIRDNAIYIGASLITCSLLSTALKYSIRRTRPFVSYPDIQKASDAGSPSFPSGHTSDAFALATSASLAFPKWYVIIPAYSWACGVGYSRMHLGVHYPSDVLAGALLGAGTAVLCHQLKKSWLSKRKHIAAF